MRPLRHPEWLFICDVLISCNSPYKFSLLIPLLQLQQHNQVKAVVVTELRALLH
jgi:hypothetical protein